MSTRPSRDQTLMDTAWAWSRRSTCDRLHVGAVFSLEGRILAQGYNGSPKGMPHCPPDHDTEDCLAVHAEANAISWAARNGVRLDFSELHVTHEPCLQCARLLVNVGVDKITFQEAYRLHDGYRLLEAAGINVLILPEPAR